MVAQRTIGLVGYGKGKGKRGRGGGKGKEGRDDGTVLPTEARGEHRYKTGGSLRDGKGGFHSA